MKIICIEGCHGCGKTEIVGQLAAAGYNTLDEGFLDMPSTSLDPQSLTMEYIWVSRWVEKVLLLRPNVTYFADRSPFSAAFYAKNGHLLRPLLDHMITELRKAGIEIITAYLHVSDDKLWRRISLRLQTEPHRVKYRENDRGWMKTVVNYYDSQTWNHTINNDGDPAAAINHLIKL